MRRKIYSFRLLVALALMPFIGLSNSTGYTQEPSSAPSVESKSATTAPEVKRVEKQASAADRSRLDEPTSILRAQLETMREYHLTLISTVYWTLGVVGGLTLALLAFASYVNWRISGRERDALRADLLGQIDQKSAEISRNLEGEASEARREIGRILDISRERVESRTTEVLDELTASIKEEVSGLDTAMERKVSPISRDIRELKYQVHQQELGIIAREADHWELTGVKANCMRSWIDYAQKANSFDDRPQDWRVEKALKEIAELLAGGYIPDAQILGNLDELLGVLGENFRLIVERVRERIRSSSERTAS